MKTLLLALILTSLAFAGERMAVERIKVIGLGGAVPSTITLATLAKPVAAGTEVLVFRNGVLMTRDEDYMLSGQVVQWTRQPIAVGDWLTYVYFTPVQDVTISEVMEPAGLPGSQRTPTEIAASLIAFRKAKRITAEAMVFMGLSIGYETGFGAGVVAGRNRDAVAAGAEWLP